MPVLISGVLKDATGTPVQNCTIQLKACRTSTTVVVNTVASENPDDAGRYSMDVEQGQYTVTLLVEGYPPSHAGVITVYDDSKPGTLNDFLGAMTEDDVRPEALRRFEAMVEEVARQASEASRNATAAGQASEQAQTSAGQAAESATAAVNAAGDAGASATAAAASEKAAAASAAAAKTSETNAATSASTAAASATAASSSASEASNHAAASDTSASLAAQSSTAAGAAATRAEDAAKRAEDIADVISLEDASLTKKGIVKLSSATDSDSEALAATPKAVHAVMDEVQTKAPLDSPVFTGTPTTPTPPDDAKGLQTANAEFVRKLIAALVGSVPESLDTLQELADALGNDPNFATTVLNKLAGKQPLDETLTALSGKSVDGLIEYVGLGEGSALPVGVPVPWPSATPPTGWLKCNGAAFSAEEYPELAKAYPTNKLPDLRGEFIRGWDDGRGIDAGRVLLSIQAGMLEKHRHPVVANDGYDSKEEWELATIFRRAYTQGRGLDAAAAGGSLIPSPTLHSRGSIGNTGGSETRPRNIAFNYIVRAA
ncbi:prophage tail fiber N-terminal domain-containing protein [Salmonella enterica]|nr:prophage tail fiber N-terminal domain-containing protein [Salmonella enterica]EHQ8866700.1 prophage tail fiber N-terminal domain-containing protein [Salmonella enterica]